MLLSTTAHLLALAVIGVLASDWVLWASLGLMAVCVSCTVCVVLRYGKIVRCTSGNKHQ